MTLQGKELDELLRAMRGAAERAGAYLAAGLNKPKQIEHKGPVDLVTEYDRRAEEIICRHLQERFPDISMLAEEGNGQAETAPGAAKWIVDPLDGTTNYSHGHPVFAVSIGLEDQVAEISPAPGATASSVAWFCVALLSGAGERRRPDDCFSR